MSISFGSFYDLRFRLYPAERVEDSMPLPLYKLPIPSGCSLAAVSLGPDWYLTLHSCTSNDTTTYTACRYIADSGLLCRDVTSEISCPPKTYFTYGDKLYLVCQESPDTGYSIDKTNLSLEKIIYGTSLGDYVIKCGDKYLSLSYDPGSNTYTWSLCNFSGTTLSCEDPKQYKPQKQVYRTYPLCEDDRLVIVYSQSKGSGLAAVEAALSRIVCDPYTASCSEELLIDVDYDLQPVVFSSKDIYVLVPITAQITFEETPRPVYVLR